MRNGGVPWDTERQERMDEATRWASEAILYDDVGVLRDHVINMRADLMQLYDRVRVLERQMQIGGEE
jgi:hypothetical protein